MAPIWGGASLLQLHLRIMNEILELKLNETWNWDYLINLSESDFPIKSVQEFTLYLSQYRNGENFLSFHNVEGNDQNINK